MYSRLRALKPGSLAGIEPAPETFLSFSCKRQLDYLIETFLHDCVEWLTGWVDCLNRMTRTSGFT